MLQQLLAKVPVLPLDPLLLQRPADDQLQLIEIGRS
jgi:hypothetical protein